MLSYDDQEHACRVCDVAEEDEPDMLPIHGYAKMPLVTLEEAVVPLVSVVPQVEHMIWTVKSNCKNPPDNLSSDESASIMLYSMAWPPPGKPFYIILNETLRHGNRSLLKPWFLYLKLVITALSKLPSEQHHLHRGIKKDLSAHYPQGKIFVWWGFSSCTKSIHVLQNELFLGKTGIRTLFHVHCKSGKDIRQHSMLKKEDEVLLLPARQFKVVSCLNVGNDLNIIDIEEIDPPYLLLEPLPASYSPPLLPIPQIKISGSYRNQDLEETIRRSPSHSVNLKGQQLKDQDMNIVIKEAIIGKQCVKLDMTYNEVTQQGASVLADTLQNNKHLEELNISFNNISDLGVRYLALAINSSVLKRINLAENDISDEGVGYLAKMLATNTNLLQLSLNGNQIGNYGIGMLANTLTHTSTRLEFLDLSANKYINDESIDSFVNLMENNQSLKKLDLRHNNLSQDAVKRLHILSKSKKGFELWLSRVM